MAWTFSDALATLPWAYLLVVGVRARVDGSACASPAASVVVSSGACMPEAQLSCSQPRRRRRRRGGGESSRRLQTRVSSRDDAASTGASAVPSSCWAARCAGPSARAG